MSDDAERVYALADAAKKLAEVSSFNVAEAAEVIATSAGWLKAEAIVRDIAARDHPGVLLSNDSESNFCCYCLAHLGIGDDHRDSCPWRRARELIGDSE